MANSKAPARKSKAATKTAAKSATIQPISENFSKSALVRYLADQAEVEAKFVKAVMSAFETAILGSVHKRGFGTFTWPGVFKITTVKVPAKPRRQGKDPFTGQERWFDAKPASVRVKARALKKLKDAAAP
ncbi:MAG: HU family DNA-binding protein [Rhodanobacter sp.]|nr:HU family DNA-binding protein [Rhodanobacter sp.]